MNNKNAIPINKKDMCHHCRKENYIHVKHRDKKEYLKIIKKTIDKD